MKDFFLKLSNRFQIIKRFENVQLKTKLPPNFGHGSQRNLPGVLELVFCDFLGFLSTAHPDLADLAFQDLQGFIFPSDPSHARIEELVRTGVNFSKLCNSV